VAGNARQAIRKPVQITVKGGQNALARTLGGLAGGMVWLFTPFWTPLCS
jgi:hypothetical protein